ncbi:hypothetical protein TCAL_16694 [Tigriopus californicus]|uniref:ZSWIM1/3 RNaseH-like domain-containing protein n=1 Tax=Tigriopus californicus TaxID=6832 RepID=A0A553PM46_TIGCA|nr:hypothetical protein TCAL_16694 [Tigriopus californicus]
MQPITLFVDSTHGTNQSKYCLISILVADSRGEGTPILQVLAESECKQTIMPAFEMLARLSPESVNKVKVLVSDLAPAFINAWKEVFPTSLVKHANKANGWEYFSQNYGPSGTIAKPEE